MLRPLALFAVLLCASDLAAGGPPPDRVASPARRPNVVLIVADDLGWNDVGFHGSEIETPHIDRLAREGVVLERFYTAPMCTPTRAALLSGRSPVQLGLWTSVLQPWDRHGLPGDEYTLARRFRDSGYQTAMIGKWHLGHARSEYLPNLHGFHSFFGSLGGALDYYTHSRGNALFQFEHDLQRDGTPAHEEGYLTRLYAEEAVAYIRNREPGRPFFLYLPHQAVHSPNQAPAEHVAKYSHLRGARRVHAAMVDALDQAVGAVLEVLDEECLTDDTLVFFTSDNGGDASFGGDNAPLAGGKNSVFEGGIRVPAVFRWPRKLPAGRVSGQLARDFDLYATLEVAANLRPLRAPGESMNLWPMLQGAPPRNDRTFFFAFGALQRAVIDGDWKLIRRIGAGLVVTTSLYDLSRDPYEQRDVADERPELVARLVDELDRNEALQPRDVGFLPMPPDWHARDEYSDYLEDPEVLAAHLDSREPQAPWPPGAGRRTGCRPPSTRTTHAAGRVATRLEF